MSKNNNNDEEKKRAEEERTRQIDEDKVFLESAKRGRASLVRLVGNETSKYGLQRVHCRMAKHALRRRKTRKSKDYGDCY